MTYSETVTYFERYYAWQQEEAQRTLIVLGKLKASGLRSHEPPRNPSNDLPQDEHEATASRSTPR